jgi:DNA-binding transcriptional MocR family regulator
MLLLRLDEKSSKSAYQQILEQIRHKIVDEHTLVPGEKLPSTRQLADQMGVHRSTVATAYQELWALGFVDLHPGARPRVRQRMQMATSANRTSRSIVDWNSAVSPAANAIWESQTQIDRKPANASSLVNLRVLDMDSRLLPVKHFRSCINRVIREHGPSLLEYGDCAGYRPLREYLAVHLQHHGISAAPDEILITNGSQHAIDLVLRMIAMPGRAVAIESPTYGYLLPLVQYFGLKALEIPLRHDGMDLELLAAAMRDEHPMLVYTMPNFQNPTGLSSSQANREELLSLCERYRTPILEDGFEEEMKYFGRVILPIKSMDKNGLVIYIGTMSKVLFPGVRIGWIAAHRQCIDRLTAIRRFSELTPNMVMQAAIHEFCNRGFYDLHVSRMHRVFRRRMQIAIRAMRQHISPDWAEWTEPAGGFLLWLKLKPGASPDIAWNDLLAAHGVQATLGQYFFYSGKPDTYLRLSISTLNDDEIVEGIQRLSRALAAAYSSTHARSSAAVRRQSWRPQASPIATRM